jgi:hypothetical protein
MTTKQHVAHVLSVILTAAIAIVTPALLPGGALASYSWAPLALASLAYLARFVGRTPPAVVLALAGGFLLRLLAAAAVVVFLASAGGCKATLGPTPPPNTPGFVNCSDAALHAAALNILPSAETAIAQANYEAAVAALIAGIGGPLALAEVACALQWIANEAALQETATGDPLEALKAEHARAWLAAHPVQFQ